jgi:cell division protein FtsI (penicillin-binding protein 3)
VAPPSSSTSRPARRWPKPVNRPTNAADWQDYPAPRREDAATSFVVDPASVHKAINFGAGLEEAHHPAPSGPVPSTIYKGGEPYMTTIVRRWRTSMPGPLAYSSTVTTIKIADKLGPRKVVLQVDAVMVFLPE